MLKSIQTSDNRLLSLSVTFCLSLILFSVPTFSHLTRYTTPSCRSMFSLSVALPTNQHLTPEQNPSKSETLATCLALLLLLIKIAERKIFPKRRTWPRTCKRYETQVWIDDLLNICVASLHKYGRVRGWKGTPAYFVDFERENINKGYRLGENKRKNASLSLNDWKGMKCVSYGQSQRDQKVQLNSWCLFSLFLFFTILFLAQKAVSHASQIHRHHFCKYACVCVFDGEKCG